MHPGHRRRSGCFSVFMLCSPTSAVFSFSVNESGPNYSMLLNLTFDKHMSVRTASVCMFTASRRVKHHALVPLDAKMLVL